MSVVNSKIAPNRAVASKREGGLLILRLNLIFLIDRDAAVFHFIYFRC